MCMRLLLHLLFFALIALILTAGTTNDTFEVTFLQYVFMAPHAPAYEHGGGTKRNHNTVNSQF